MAVNGLLFLFGKTELLTTHAKQLKRILIVCKTVTLVNNDTTKKNNHALVIINNKLDDGCISRHMSILLQ